MHAMHAGLQRSALRLTAFSGRAKGTEGTQYAAVPSCLLAPRKQAGTLCSSGRQHLYRRNASGSDPARPGPDPHICIPH